MKSKLRRTILHAFTGVVLTGALVFGFCVTIVMQRQVDTEQQFFTETLYTQTSSLNRVIFAAQDYISFPRVTDLPETMVPQKIELARRVVSHASLPHLIDADTFASVIADDPLLLRNRLDSTNAAYRHHLSRLTTIYQQLAAATRKKERHTLLMEFETQYNRFYQALKDQSAVTQLLDDTYHSHMKAIINDTQRVLQYILIVQAIAVAASIILITLLVRAYIREIRSLHGLIPICANCKKVRDDEGYWGQVETYIKQHSEADFTHGICPECEKQLYPGIK